MKISLPLISIIIVFNFGCQKDPDCGENVVIDSLELSPEVEEGLLLKGTERIVFNDGDGNRIIFKSPANREYLTKKELLYVICGNDDYRNNQYEVVETENYSITYTDSLDLKKVMVINAEIRRTDSLLEENLNLKIMFDGKRQCVAPYVWRPRFNVPKRIKYDVPGSLHEKNPFANIIFDTIFNNQPYQGVIKFGSDWGPVFYNRYGILQFKQLGDKVWTIESIN
jgi:hypothetical protein